MKSTFSGGELKPIQDCYIEIPEFGSSAIIVMNILPEISDSKGANYADVTAIGRSFPIKNYAYSENRTISWTAHFMVCKEGDQIDILRKVNLLRACVYPSNDESPYAPPPICRIKCGQQLSSGQEPLCCVLRSYSLKIPTDVAWDETTYIPYKLDMELSFEVVYNSSDLPFAEDIRRLGG